MRKALLYAMFLISAVATGCSDQTDLKESSAPEMPDEIAIQYQSKFEFYTHLLDSLTNELKTCNQTRSTDDDRTKGILTFITQTPKETIDSLYYANYAECNRERIDLYDPKLYKALVAVSSEKEANALFDFIEKYIERNGNDMTYLASNLPGNSNLIQDIMISCAAIIDNIIIEGRLIIDPNSYCLHLIQLKLIESLVTDEIADEILGIIATTPLGEAVILLGMASYSLYDGVKLAYEFYECITKGIS